MLNSRTPQHDLRACVPQRTELRVAASPRHHALLAAHLTIRDRWLARMIAEHRVLTTTQITDLAFPSRRATNLRLRRLYQWRVLDRFQPYIGQGRAPLFYVLDSAGAQALAYEDGIDPTELRFRPERSLGISHAHRLAHLHGVNSFFSPLIHHARTRSSHSLDAWWPETRCARHVGDRVLPDAYGRWTEHGRTIEWFLEWDTGHYQLARLAAKLRDYAHLAATTAITTPVLFCFTSPRRETHARDVLTSALRDLPRPADVPIATTNTTEIAPPHTAADAVWLPLDHTTTGRHTLAGLTTAWPDLPAPAPHSGTPSSPGDCGLARLRLPAPMPPWTSTADLTWHQR